MIGYISALSSAAFWAVASKIFETTGKDQDAMQLNFLKGLIAAFLLGITLLLLPSNSTIGLRDTSLLIISGIIGIGLGDTAFFLSLSKLGVSKTLIISALAPGVTVIIGSMTLGEFLSPSNLIGIALTIVGILIVVWENHPKNSDNLSKAGLFWAILATVSQALGVVISRAALKGSEIDPLFSAFIRLFGGIFVLLVIFLLSRKRILYFTNSFGKKVKIFVFAVIIGTYLCMWLQQIAIKAVDAGIAQTLISTSPIFVLIIMVIKREYVPPRSFIGAFTAVLGVTLLFLI